MATLVRQVVGILAVTALAVTVGHEAMAACPTPPTNHDCKCNGDDSAWVCASWGTAGTPQEGFDFVVTFPGGGAAPNVEFRTGDPGWKIYGEETASPNDLISIGDITLDPTAAEAALGTMMTPKGRKDKTHGRFREHQGNDDGRRS